MTAPLVSSSPAGRQPPLNQTDQPWPIACGIPQRSTGVIRASSPLRVGAVRPGEVALEPVEEARHVGGRDLVAAPEARRRLEVPHPGTPRHLLESLVPDAGVDGVGGSVVRVGDHRLEQGPRLLVERQVLALQPSQLGGQQQRLADARGAELAVGVVAAQPIESSMTAKETSPRAAAKLLCPTDPPVTMDRRSRGQTFFRGRSAAPCPRSAAHFRERVPATRRRDQSGRCDSPRRALPTRKSVQPARRPTACGWPRAQGRGRRPGGPRSGRGRAASR